MRFLLEPNVFGRGLHPMTDAVTASGFEAVKWNDDWWENTNEFPSVDKNVPTLFHGSLGNARDIANLQRWEPGSYCNEAAFRCSSWYETAQPWLIQQKYVYTTVEEFVNSPMEIGSTVGENEKVFVRPDSPLKPFSGRVVTLDGLTLRQLDHGFYYDDVTLPIVVAGLCEEITEEWRFVVIDGEICAASSYEAETRQGKATKIPEDVRAFADDVVKNLDPPPEPVYILDVGRMNTKGSVSSSSSQQLGLVELNPFSGADLYNCDYVNIIQALAEYLN